jgi:NADPH2:quinone reductase
MQRATMRGLIVTDHFDRWPEAIGALGELWGSGQLRHDETLVPGLDQAPAALTGLLAGDTTGKLVVTIAEPTTIPGHPLTIGASGPVNP